MKVALKMLPRQETADEPEVRGPRFRIGRGHGCDLRLESRLVSRRHCELTIRDDVVYVEDLHSHNGTYVNGHRIVGQHALEDGDLLCVGTSVFEVQIRPEASSLSGLNLLLQARQAVSRMLGHREGAVGQKAAAARMN